MAMAYLNGDVKKAAEMQKYYLDFINALFIETNPIPIKEAMNLVGMGLGVTLIPGYMNNFNTGQVVFRPIAGNVPSIALLMAWKKGEMKPALRDFIAIVQERLANVTA